MPVHPIVLHDQCGHQRSHRVGSDSIIGLVPELLQAVQGLSQGSAVASPVLPKAGAKQDSAIDWLTRGRKERAEPGAAGRGRAMSRVLLALLLAVLHASVAAGQPRSGLLTAWSTECFAAAKKGGARTGRAVRYCECASSFAPRAGAQNYAAWKETHPDEAAFCAEKVGITTGPGRGY
jgi:hypothetical protein